MIWRALILPLALATPVAAQDIRSAQLSLPTDRYDHAILGDALEWGGLDMTLAGGRVVRIILPQSRVFEDITARVADLDGDGVVEIAYIDRPHLARELVLVRMTGGTLTEVVRIKGLTNHQIGDNQIRGGTRSCGGENSLILASADWARMVQVRLTADGPQTTDIGPLRRKADLDQSTRCP